MLLVIRDGFRFSLLNHEKTDNRFTLRNMFLTFIRRQKRRTIHSNTHIQVHTYVRIGLLLRDHLKGKCVRICVSVARSSIKR